jgi:FG-GAP-like repeat/Secretion system C-terminal sorting domain
MTSKKNLLFCVFFISSLPIIFAQATFEENVISYNETNISGLAIADLNNDGRNEIVSSAFGKNVLWWEYDSLANSWEKHIIDNTNNGAMYIYVADIDGDEMLDVVASGVDLQGPKIMWYKNNGNDEEWGKNTISTFFRNGHGIYAGDIDNDGDMDVVSSSEGANKISWFENMNGDGSDWEQRIVLENIISPQAVCLADINNDSYLDIIAASSGENKIVCLWNLNGDGTNWLETNIDHNASLPHWVDAIDMDNDGDMDIYACMYITGTVSWYENDRPNNVWIEHQIETNATLTLATHAGDVDFDGDYDFVVTSGGYSSIVFLENTGDNLSYNTQILGSDYSQAWPVAVGDLDNNSSPDIVAGANASGKLSWFKNEMEVSIFNHNVSSNNGIDFKVFPNPVCDQINVYFELDKKSEITIELADLAGKRIVTLEKQISYKQYFSKEYSLHNIEPGLYLVNAKVNDFMNSKLVVIY